MSESTSTASPAEENVKNARDDLMYNALDTFMKNPVQSYDEFVNGFSFLKENKPELVPSLQTRAKQRQSAEAQSSVTASTSVPPPPVNLEDTGPVKSTSNIVNDIKRRRLGKIITTNQPMHFASENLETEILPDGDTSSRLSGCNVIKTGSLKVDNFVEADDDIEEVTPDYTASFSTRSPRLRATAEPMRADESTAADSPMPPPDTAIEPLFDSQLSLEENSTDKLLMNFLADLQNEMNVKGPSVQNTTSTEASDTRDIQNIVNRQFGNAGNTGKCITADTVTHESKSSQGKQASVKKEIVNKSDVQANAGKHKPEGVDNEDEENDDIDFDDDDCDAALTLCDQEEQAEVKVEIKPGDLEKVKARQSEQSNNQAEKLKDIYKSALMDSEGVVRTAAAERMLQGEDTGRAGEEGAKDMVFPGEVEVGTDVPVHGTETLLEFKATYTDKSPSQAEDSSTHTQVTDETCDEVQPFQLDQDFDYDNVVLTPKYSESDLQLIRQGMQAMAQSAT